MRGSIPRGMCLIRAADVAGATKAVCCMRMLRAAAVASARKWHVPYCACRCDRVHASSRSPRCANFNIVCRTRVRPLSARMRRRRLPAAQQHEMLLDLSVGGGGVRVRGWTKEGNDPQPAGTPQKPLGSGSGFRECRPNLDTSRACAAATALFMPSASP